MGAAFLVYAKKHLRDLQTITDVCEVLIDRNVVNWKVPWGTNKRTDSKVWCHNVQCPRCQQYSWKEERSLFWLCCIRCPAWDFVSFFTCFFPPLPLLCLPWPTTTPVALLWVRVPARWLTSAYFSPAPSSCQVVPQSALSIHTLECFHPTANWGCYLVLQKQILQRCFLSKFWNFCHQCIRICNYSNVPLHPAQLPPAPFPLIRNLSYNFRLELEHKAVIGPFCSSLCRFCVVKMRRLLFLNLSTPWQ